MCFFPCSLRRPMTSTKTASSKLPPRKLPSRSRSPGNVAPKAAAPEAAAPEFGCPRRPPPRNLLLRSAGARERPRPRRWVAVFDLDGTLTWRDKLFHSWRAFCAGTRGACWAMASAVAPCPASSCRIAIGLAEIASHPHVMGEAPASVIDACADSFVDTLRPRRRRETRRAAMLEAIAPRAITWSVAASPDIYVPRIGPSGWASNAPCAPRSNGGEIAWRVR